MPGRNTVRPIVRIAPALAGVAGYVDAVGFITLRGLFVAHMSGNSVKLGVSVGQGEFGAAVPAAVAVVLFVAGVAVGTITAEVGARRRVHSVGALVLAIQTALIVAFMLYGATLLAGHTIHSRTLSGFYVLAALAIMSMGMQTSALRQFAGRTISTTYVTGVLTSLTQEATNYLFWLRDRAGRDEEHSFLSRVLGLGSRRDSRDAVRILAVVWLAYAGGGMLGSFLDSRLELWALVVPLALLLIVIARDLRRPILP